MTKSNYLENVLVKALFNSVALPSWGANVQVNLHTADPGEAGTATTSAATYTGYAPVTVSRDGAGWTICDPDAPYTANANGSAAKNTAEVTFPECTGGTNTITHGSISVVGTGEILYKGALLAPLAVANLQTPRFPAGTMVFKED